MLIPTLASDSNAQIGLGVTTQPTGSTDCCASTRKSVGSFPELKSTLTCPQCGHVSAETMPTAACVYFYECSRCHEVLNGDCCVFCSYGIVPCPPIQEGNSCC